MRIRRKAAINPTTAQIIEIGRPDLSRFKARKVMTGRERGGL
jgi:hypothetical protein